MQFDFIILEHHKNTESHELAHISWFRLKKSYISKAMNSGHHQAAFGFLTRYLSLVNEVSHLYLRKLIQPQKSFCDEVSLFYFYLRIHKQYLNFSHLLS